MKALKPPSYTDRKGRVRDGFYPSPHNKITRTKPADALYSAAFDTGTTTRLLGIVKPISSIAGADPRSDGTMGESQGL